MSKWMDMLVHKKDIIARYELEERAAIVQFDGEESESEYRAISDFIDENKGSLKKYLKTIDGELYLKLKNI